VPGGDVTLAATILVVDDHHLVRRTLHSLLAQQPHWKIYEAANGQLAVDQILEIKPDVVVMDIVMPVMSGIEAAYEVRRRVPDTKIILMSSHYTPEEAALLARLFGDGNFVPKSATGTELVAAINRVLTVGGQTV
jgi:DNA-binding NarL/FixJ family response regulator